MIPDERSLVEKLKGRPFVLLGVDSDESVETLKAALARDRMTWPQIFDGGADGPAATQWGIQGWPTIFVIDAQGVIRCRDARGPELEQAVLKLLSEIK